MNELYVVVAIAMTPTQPIINVIGIFVNKGNAEEAKNRYTQKYKNLESYLKFQIQRVETDFTVRGISKEDILN